MVFDNCVVYYSVRSVCKICSLKIELCTFRNGTEWWRIRREFQKGLSKPRNIANYLEDTDAVVQEFVRLCAREKTDDLQPLISRLFLNCKFSLNFKAAFVVQKGRYKLYYKLLFL